LASRKYIDISLCSLDSVCVGTLFVAVCVVACRFKKCSCFDWLVAHCSYIFAEYNQQNVTFHNLFISVGCSTCFRRFSVHHQEFQTAHTASDICQTNTAGRARLAAGSNVGLTNTWRCMCSFELLMMDGKPVWNMWRVLQECVDKLILTVVYWMWNY